VLIEIEDLDTVPLVVSGLEQAGVSVSVHGRSIVASGNDDAVFDICRDVCASRNAPITRLNRRRLSLEDVFLETTDL
jgi:hypothetical protein